MHEWGCEDDEDGHVLRVLWDEHEKPAPSLPACLPTDRYCKLLSPWKRAGESSDRELNRRSLFQHSIQTDRSPASRRDAREPHTERS